MRVPIWACAVGVVVAAAVGVACGGSSSAGSQLTVTAVERGFVTRAFGGELSVVLVYSEIEPEPPVSFVPRATGTDGIVYSGGQPRDVNICGLADYLGGGTENANERVAAFVVPPAVQLTEMAWKPTPESDERVVELPDEQVVCVP